MKNKSALLLLFFPYRVAAENIYSALLLRFQSNGVPAALVC
jgi:hypothetical protein